MTASRSVAALLAASLLALLLAPSLDAGRGHGRPRPTPSPSASPSPSLTPSPTAALSGFVRRSGARLTLDGAPYAFVGLNVYNANSRDDCWYSLGRDDGALAATLDASGVRAFRAWFPQGLATTSGARDWAAFDHTLAVARSRGVKVVPVMSVEDCRGDGVASRQTPWLESGYRAAVAPGHLVPFRDYVAEVASRYRDDPAVLAWQVGNEWEIKNADGTCGPASTLDAFAADVAGVVKANDPNHLVSFGTIGTGQCGARGSAEYRALHSPASIDLCEYHDYQPGALPGDQWNGLLARVADCAALDKPLFVGEAGVLASDPDRPAELAAKRDAQLAAGVVGWLPWEWRAAGQAGGDAYVIADGDPALALVR